jgi:hypothetical protein
VYADRRVPEALLKDELLYGECLSGALYVNDFRTMVSDLGFATPMVVSMRPLAIGNAEVQAKLGPIGFFSVTYRLFKCAGSDHFEEDYGQALRYRGTVADHEHVFKLSAKQQFPTGKVVGVSRNTFLAVTASRFRAHFDVYDAATDGQQQHFGAFGALQFE